MLDVGVLVASVIVYHLSGLNFISQVSCHFCNLCRSFCSKEVSFCVLIDLYKMQSSAKSRTLVDRLSGRSFM